jgi:hypothetical protein
MVAEQQWISEWLRNNGGNRKNLVDDALEAILTIAGEFNFRGFLGQRRTRKGGRRLNGGLPKRSITYFAAKSLPEMAIPIKVKSSLFASFMHWLRQNGSTQCMDWIRSTKSLNSNKIGDPALQELMNVANISMPQVPLTHPQRKIGGSKPALVAL